MSLHADVAAHVLPESAGDGGKRGALLFQIPDRGGPLHRFPVDLRRHLHKIF